VRLLCIFLPCPWQYVGEINWPRTPPGQPLASQVFGLYQCPRCKTLSHGSPVPPELRPRPQEPIPVRKPRPVLY
jgi:hypothetical protein